MKNSILAQMVFFITLPAYRATLINLTPIIVALLFFSFFCEKLRKIHNFVALIYSQLNKSALSEEYTPQSQSQNRSFGKASMGFEFAGYSRNVREKHFPDWRIIRQNP
ncbi:MAG: hypothetical protein LBG26_08255 [Treponema sp.]|jgi:hypothetical protein|nr:hypothetical protein [Treponema sp.]